MTDTPSDPVPLARVVFDAAATSDKRTLAVEWALALLEAPPDTVGVADYRHVVLVLTTELEHANLATRSQAEQDAINRAGLDEARATLDATRARLL